MESESDLNGASANDLEPAWGLHGVIIIDASLINFKDTNLMTFQSITNS